MISRRTLFLASAGACIAAHAGPAFAFTMQPYDKAAADKAIAAGKRVVVHVYASWCLQCHSQAGILDDLAKEGTYDAIAFFRVDYTAQADIVKALGVPRATLLGYEGGKEVSRMSWGTDRSSVEQVLKAVLRA